MRTIQIKRKKLLKEHLIEQDSKFALSHGEAVAIGMIYELGLSKKHFGLPQEIIDLYISYLEKLDYKKSYEFENSIDYLLGILFNSLFNIAHCFIVNIK